METLRSRSEASPYPVRHSIDKKPLNSRSGYGEGTERLPTEKVWPMAYKGLETHTKLFKLVI